MGGRLFKAGCLSTFSAFRMGAYSRWALIRGWALNRINTVYKYIATKVTINFTQNLKKDKYFDILILAG